MISAGQDNTIRIWDPEDMTCLRVIQEGRSEITAMTFSSALNMPITGRSMLRSNEPCCPRVPSTCQSQVGQC